MIELKNCATYHDTGASIENCQKINFFYGTNGSEKSTIGNFLKNPSDSQYTDCSSVGEFWAQQSQGKCLFVMTCGENFEVIKQLL